MEASQTGPQPTPEEVRNATEVSTAAAEAIATSENAEQARSRADEAIERRVRELKITLSDEDRTKMVDELIERLSSLGAFDPPAPAPAAEAPSAAPAPELAAEEAAAAAAKQTPQKKTFAERFAGL